MRTWVWLLFAMVCVLDTDRALTAERPAGAKDDEGFVRLFNGKDLTGWQTGNMAKPAGGWNRMVVTCEGTGLQVKFH
jgi:hypothetical protein